MQPLRKTFWRSVAALIAVAVQADATLSVRAAAAEAKKPTSVEAPLLLQKPALSPSQVAFEYAADLWIVDRNGGDARRLTAGVGLEGYPVFSPNGKSIAFAGEYEGNLDVYVIPAAGGIPTRLTHHPDPDVPVCWTPDGKNIIFRSTRHSYARFVRLFSVPATGGQPTELPLPMGEEAALSPDGLRIAYTPFSNKPQFPGRMRPLKNYRGGTASPIWIADLRDSSILKVERKDEVTFNPMWIGDTIYYLSDRDGLTTIFACDVSGKGVRRIVDPEKADVKTASACGDTIVFDRFGTLNLLDLKTRKITPI
jgi:tricorn protease